MTTDARLDAISDHLVDRLRAHLPEAREGVVRGRRPAPYRRVDCDGRALAYLRARPRLLRGVRVDLSGLWVRPPLDSPRLIEGRTGSASLVCRTEREAAEVAAFLAAAVRHTRALLQAERVLAGLPSIGANRHDGRPPR